MKLFSADLHKRDARTYPKSRILAAVLLISLLTVYFCLSAIVTHFVNRKIKVMGEYRGRLEKVSLDLWRGAYAIEGLVLEKMSGEAPVPFFSAKRVDLNVQWRALLRGKIAGDAELYEPSLNFVKSKDPEARQTDVSETDWREHVRELTPFDVNSIRIHRGIIRYKDLDTDPKIDIYLCEIEAEAKNLTNVQDKKNILKSTVAAKGRAMEKGAFQVFLALEPFEDEPTFEAKSHITADLEELNDFLKAYLSVEADGGTLDVYLEGAAAQGKFKGYAKPLMGGIDAGELDNETGGPLEIIKGSLVQASAALFKNREKNDVATKVTFEGTFDDPGIDILGAVINFFRNAFLEGILPGFDGSAEVTERGRLVDEEGKPVEEDKSAGGS